MIALTMVSFKPSVLDEIHAAANTLCNRRVRRGLRTIRYAVHVAVTGER
jgi:hypothetical protein